MELVKEKKGIFCTLYLVRRELFYVWFISMYSVLKTLSEYTFFCISKNITPYTLLLVFKIIESPQCILKQQNAHKKSFTQISGYFIKLANDANVFWRKRLIWLLKKNLNPKWPPFWISRPKGVPENSWNSIKLP